jgi:hypothetical protein
LIIENWQLVIDFCWKNHFLQLQLPIINEQLSIAQPHAQNIYTNLREKE